MQYQAPNGDRSRFNLSWLPDAIDPSFVPHRVGNEFKGLISGIGAWGRAHGYLPIRDLDEDVEDVTQSVCDVLEADLTEAHHSDGAKAELFPRAQYKKASGDVALLLDIRDSFFYSLVPVSHTVSVGGSGAIISRERVSHPALVLVETDLGLRGLHVQPVLCAAAYAECLDRIDQIGAFLSARGDGQIVLSDIPEPSWILSVAIEEILRTRAPREINHASEGVWIPNVHSVKANRSGDTAVLRVEVDIEVWKSEANNQISNSVRREDFEFTVSRSRAQLVSVEMNTSRKDI